MIISGVNLKSVRVTVTGAVVATVVSLDALLRR